MCHTIFFESVETSSVAQAARTANIIEGVTDPDFGLTHIGTHHKQRSSRRGGEIIVTLKPNFDLASTNQFIKA